MRTVERCSSSDVRGRIPLDPFQHLPLHPPILFRGTRQQPAGGSREQRVRTSGQQKAKTLIPCLLLTCCCCCAAPRPSVRAQSIIIPKVPLRCASILDKTTSVRFFGLVIDIWWRSVYCGSVRRVAFVFLGWRGRDLVFAVASLPRGQWGRGARGADPD